MNTQYVLGALFLLSAAFSVAAQEPDATSLPRIKAQPIQHVFDCRQQTLPSQRQVGEWTGQHNFSQIYATRVRLMGDVARHCNKPGVEQVNLVFESQPGRSNQTHSRWIAHVDTGARALSATNLSVPRSIAMKRFRIPHLLIATTTALAVSGPAAARDPGAWGAWGDPQYAASINTIAAAEGCPIESPDGLSLFIASNRSAPGAQGKLDVYRARRTSTHRSWGMPENLGAPVNSTEFDYCPTPLHGRWLMFVSSRVTADDCHPGDTAPVAPPGGPAAGDMYLTYELPRRGWVEPLHLGCYPEGPNTAGAEFSPALIHTWKGTFLFFSSNGYPDSQGQDIYMSRVLLDGTVLPGQRVHELSSPADDRMPNLSQNGLEIVFSSNRAGASAFDQDIYVARRSSTKGAWSAPVRIDNPFINTPASETRASLSGDGTRLYFGRKLTVEDPGDVYVSTRRKGRGRHGR